MRPRLLKKFFRKGEITFGIGIGIVVARLVVDQYTKKAEKEALKEQERNGALAPTTGRNLRILRTVRGVLHIL